MSFLGFVYYFIHSVLLASYNNLNIVSLPEFILKHDPGCNNRKRKAFRRSPGHEGAPMVGLGPHVTRVWKDQLDLLLLS